MIVLDEGDHHRLITQPDHARFAGELVALWRSHRLPQHPRRDDLLFAVREHDNGWREADAAPSWNAAAGRPHDFLSMPTAARVEIWRRGTLRFATERPYAALLVTLHVLRLARPSGAATAELTVELEERADELAEAAGATRREAEEDDRLLAFADAASLAVGCHWTDPFARSAPRWAAEPGGTLRGRFDPGTGTLHLDPFPLAGTTSFTIPVRHIPRRRYAGDADLGGESAAARWERLTVRVGPQPSADGPPQPSRPS